MRPRGFVSNRMSGSKARDRHPSFAYLPRDPKHLFRWAMPLPSSCRTRSSVQTSTPLLMVCSEKPHSARPSANRKAGMLKQKNHFHCISQVVESSRRADRGCEPIPIGFSRPMIAAAKRFAGAARPAPESFAALYARLMPFRTFGSQGLVQILDGDSGRSASFSDSSRLHRT